MTISTGYLSLGSNLGDRLGTLRAAFRALAEHAGLRMDPARDVASLFETIPLGGPIDQPPFLNSVLRLQSSLSAMDLVVAALAIEASLGRVRSERWGPRVIDIDLLMLGNSIIDSPALQLPHPLLAERRFVLEPLSELAAELLHPVSGISIGAMTEHIRRVQGKVGVTRVAGPEWVLDAPSASSPGLRDRIGGAIPSEHRAPAR